MHILSADQATRNRIASFSVDGKGILQIWDGLALASQSGIVLLAQAGLAGLSYTLAVAVLSEDRASTWATQVLRDTFVLLLVCRLAAVFLVRLNRRSLRHPSAQDLLSIVWTVLISSILFCALTRWQFRQLAIPLAVFLMDAAFLVLFWGGLHFGGRILRKRNFAAQKAGKRVLIVGAGDAGVTVLKELALASGLSCRPVAVIDDDPQKWGRSIYGVRVAGGTRDLARIAGKTGASEILICIPSANRVQMREILQGCRRCSLPVRTLPSLSELVEGRVSRPDFRRPRIGDLLQRHEIEIDVPETRKVVGGKTVLVTGAGGSIGSELCRQIADANPRKLLLLERSENSLFYVHRETYERLGATRVKPLLLDLLQVDCLGEALQAERPEIVFHAAAHKHVGLLEMHPYEAVRNNVLGTRNVAEAALECGVERFVNISTDKAVNPENYMGVSKKLTEMCIQELARRTGAKFSNVRFGNVAGSTGSVLRLFWDQIQMGKPIRVTDPRATRYFMTISEAVHLILRAAALSKGGETFVFDMGEPLNIYELARTMMLFAGIKPGEDLPIEFTGLKPGEKVKEELWESWERASPTECERIFSIRERRTRDQGILTKIREMEKLLAREDRDGLLKLVGDILPKFRSGARQVAAPITAQPSILATVSAPAIGRSAGVL